MSSRFVALAMKKTARLSRLSGTLPNKRWELNVYIQKREGKKEPLISQRQRLGLRRINVCSPNVLGPTHNCLPTRPLMHTASVGQPCWSTSPTQGPAAKQEIKLDVIVVEEPHMAISACSFRSSSSSSSSAAAWGWAFPLTDGNISSLS